MKQCYETSRQFGTPMLFNLVIYFLFINTHDFTVYQLGSLIIDFLISIIAISLLPNLLVFLLLDKEIFGSPT